MIRRTEARLTRTSADGNVSMGLAGSWAAGAVLVDSDEPARFDQVTTGRAAIFTGGPSGCQTTATAGAGSRTRSTRQQLQRLMRDAEADITEALSNEGWLTVLDGPLHHPSPPRPARHRLREDAPPPHARPRALGQRAGADGRGTVGPLRDGGRPLRLLPCAWATRGPGRALGRASPASRCRQASAAPPRSRRPTRPRAGCRASRRRCTGTRGPR